MRKVPMLDAGEARELFRLGRAGDRRAARRFMAGHLWLVVEVAEEYRVEHYLLDLIEGRNAGLMRAMESFPAEAGGSLIDYARPEILRGMAEEGA